MGTGVELEEREESIFLLFLEGLGVVPSFSSCSSSVSATFAVIRSWREGVD